MQSGIYLSLPEVKHTQSHCFRHQEMPHLLTIRGRSTCEPHRILNRMGNIPNTALLVYRASLRSCSVYELSLQALRKD